MSLQRCVLDRKVTLRTLWAYNQYLRTLFMERRPGRRGLALGNAPDARILPNTPSDKVHSMVLILKPIFHLKTGLRWGPDANEIYTKNMKCTCPTRKFCVGVQRNLYSTGLRLGFASGKTQLLGFASGKNAKNVCHPTPEIPTSWYILRWVTQNSGVGCSAQRQPPT